MLKFIADQQRLTRIDEESPVRGTVGLKAAFLFKGDCWKEAETVTVSYDCGNSTSYEVMVDVDSNGYAETVVPWEALKKTRFVVAAIAGSAFPTNGVVVITGASGYRGNGETPSSPSETVYDQLLAKFNEAVSAVGSIEEITNEAKASAVSAAGYALEAEKYAEIASGGGVTSWNGRGGSVSPQSGDYTADMVGAVSTDKVGTAGGVASLGTDGKVPSAQLPEMDYDSKGSAAAALSDAKAWVTDQGYTTMTAVENKGYQTESQVSSTVSAGVAVAEAYVDAKGYTTMTDVEAKGYQTADDVESAITAKNYTTMAKVEAKKYQTSTQVNSAITAKGYTTMTEVEAKGYQTADEVQAAIEAAGSSSSGYEKVATLTASNYATSLSAVLSKDCTELYIHVKASSNSSSSCSLTVCADASSTSGTPSKTIFYCANMIYSGYEFAMRVMLVGNTVFTLSQSTGTNADSLADVLSYLTAYSSSAIRRIAINTNNSMPNGTVIEVYGR